MKKRQNILILGLGGVGRYLTEQLVHEGHAITVIESNAKTIRKLESGLTPIAMRHHVVVLGWTNRTPEIVKKLLEARGRLTRFLARRDAGKLRVVVLAGEVGPEIRYELREHLGDFDGPVVSSVTRSGLQPVLGQLSVLVREARESAPTAEATTLHRPLGSEISIEGASLAVRADGEAWGELPATMRAAAGAIRVAAGAAGICLPAAGGWLAGPFFSRRGSGFRHRAAGQGNQPATLPG